MPTYYFNRLDQLHALIKRKATGPPVQLAKRLRVSERTVFSYISILKAQGAEIKFSRARQSYYYTCDGFFDFTFKKTG
ncbi:putative DNA-binding transcriptional regulator YafY [Pedobacter sp. UYP24]